MFINRNVRLVEVLLLESEGIIFNEDGIIDLEILMETLIKMAVNIIKGSLIKLTSSPYCGRIILCYVCWLNCSS